MKLLILIITVLFVGCGADDQNQALSEGQPLECQQDCSMENYELYVGSEQRIFKQDGNYLFVSLNAKLSSDSEKDLNYFVENHLDSYFTNYIKIDIATGDITEDTGYKNDTEKNWFEEHPSSFNMFFEKR